MSFFVYLVHCNDGSLYCGYTTDLNKRIEAHNTGKGAKYTNKRRPVKLVYFEKLEDKSSALKREYAIKQLHVTQKWSLIRSRGL
jgi:putative endonuclease